MVTRPSPKDHADLFAFVIDQRPDRDRSRLTSPIACISAMVPFCCGVSLKRPERSGKHGPEHRGIHAVNENR